MRGKKKFGKEMCKLREKLIGICWKLREKEKKRRSWHYVADENRGKLMEITKVKKRKDKRWKLTGARWTNERPEAVNKETLLQWRLRHDIGNSARLL